jgi:hypothetical protein
MAILHRLALCARNNLVMVHDGEGHTTDPTGKIPLNRRDWFHQANPHGRRDPKA